jgi:hypothetical protein
VHVAARLLTGDPAALAVGERDRPSSDAAALMRIQGRPAASDAGSRDALPPPLGLISPTSTGCRLPQTREAPALDLGYGSSHGGNHARDACLDRAVGARAVRPWWLHGSSVT